MQLLLIVSCDVAPLYEHCCRIVGISSIGGAVNNVRLVKCGAVSKS